MMKDMSKDPSVIFVCEHGAAKSVLAATYFNHFASELGLNLRAVGRGTNPDRELSTQAVNGLSEDGLTPSESGPQPLTEADIESAQRLVAFCELPEKYRRSASIEYWQDIPPVSENYERARDSIVKRIRLLLDIAGWIH